MKHKEKKTLEYVLHADLSDREAAHDISQDRKTEDKTEINRKQWSMHCTQI